MSHSDALNLLFPIQIENVDKEFAVDGNYLDAAQSSADNLNAEMFPDGADSLLADWERVCGLVPAADDTVQKRQNRVITQLRALGGLSRQYFIQLAASMGYTISIQELQPFRAGKNKCGDKIYIKEVIFIWQVSTPGRSPIYKFTAGRSVSGERLGWWTINYQPELESFLQDLKPAHTCVIFNYI
jgi:uncharacterized protein YmfQ (DUF2313 family)